jgi:hypothetical protein
MKTERLQLRLSQEDRAVFEAVAEATGFAEVSAALRFVMREKHRELGLATLRQRTKPARITQAK